MLDSQVLWLCISRAINMHLCYVCNHLQGGDLYTALRHHSETMRWDRLGRKVALDVALGLNYLHAQVTQNEARNSLLAFVT
jgi:hypothetical protein